MTMNKDAAIARITRQVPEAEASVDEAIIKISSLITTLVQARQVSDVPAATGQMTLMRLSKVQMSLVQVGNDVLRAHKDLAKIGEVHAGFHIHECPPAGFAGIENNSKQAA
jgi:Cu/Zn superoxide dismutase